MQDARRTKEQQRADFLRGKVLDPRDESAQQFLQRGQSNRGVDDPNDMSLQAQQNRQMLQGLQRNAQRDQEDSQAKVFFGKELPPADSVAGKQAMDFAGRKPLNQTGKGAEDFLGGNRNG